VFRRGVVAEKYGILEGGWRTNNITTPFGYGLWRSIMKGWEDFGRHTSSGVGDGRSISFWTHKWCGEDELWEVFPNIYRVSCQREMTVHQVSRSHEEEVHWDLRFRTNLQDWELEEFY